MQQLLNNTTTAKQIEGSVSASNPAINQSELKQVVRNWISKQGKHWPSELNTDVLTDNLKLLYLPYWIVSGKGSAQWSASIGVERQVPKRCSTCDGRGRYTPIWSTEAQRCDNCAGTGQMLGTETFWTSQSGLVEAEATRLVKENFDTNALNLKCGDRQFSINSFWVENDQAGTYNVITPISTKKDAGQKAAHLAVEDELRSKARSIASGMGSVRDLQVGYTQTTNLQSQVWLYPMYLGHYLNGTEQLPVQIDGITKKIWADVPSDVKSLRRKDRNRKIAYGVATVIALIVIFLITDYLVLVSRPCGNLDNLLGNPSDCALGINPSDIYGWEQAAISPDGEMVAIRNDWDSDSYIDLYRLQDGEYLDRLSVGPIGQRGEEMAFSPDGSLLAVGADDAVTLWNVVSGRRIHTFDSSRTSSNRPNFAWTLDFSPDNKMLTVGYEDGTAKIWQLTNNELVYTLRGHDGAVRAIAFSPNGRLLATGDFDGSLRLWQVSNGKLLKTFDGHNGWISGVAFSSNSKQLISASGYGTIKLWDVEKGELDKTIQVDVKSEGSREWISGLQPSPDSTIVAITIFNQYNNSRVQIWDIEKSRLLQTTGLGSPAIFLSIRGEHQNNFIGFNYTSDGRLFVIQRQNVSARGYVSLDRFFSPGDVFPAIAVREMEP